MTRPTEDSLIARFFAPIADQAGLGLRDDAACFAPTPGRDLVLTVDALVESVHFLPDDPPGSVARKALGVNVSDLAAKGADPRGFLLSLALPMGWTEEWLAAFAAGLGEAAREFGCPLLGGDTVKASGALSLSVTALGEVPSGRMVRRTTARPGDAICVSGTIGDAALGLDLRRDPAWAAFLSEDERSHLADRYLHPRPRHGLARALRRYAHAAMDVSDGLAGDLAKMLRVSGVTGWVDAEAVPLSDATRRAVGVEPRLLDRALTGGDDYEILCTCPKDRIDSLVEEADKAGVPVTVIGQVLAGEGLPAFRFGDTERRFETGSFSHF
ncbi:thiamine-phosphate kinase [Microvirga pudoricolor]|uniref:thiamine-phosphate kinase n=1 Tax=Microvirga pudoricolor TaxID=2778729 RepID=UPI00194E803F|nr:thiamine-phosphate kinase [Microvirga pudoricolor]MBM6595525.1 thiamine-phosphate kinase [Microvirga pudoricolor]